MSGIYGSCMNVPFTPIHFLVRNQKERKENFFFQSLMDFGIDAIFSKIGHFKIEGTLFEIGGNKKSQR